MHDGGSHLPVGAAVVVFPAWSGPPRWQNGSELSVRTPVRAAARPVPPEGKAAMIFIVVKFKTKPEWTERWLDLVAGFTEATRAEPGNLWFDWSRSVDEPNEFVLVEAFKDDAAGDHVNSEHFKKAMADMPQALAGTPRIVSRQLDGEGWDLMGELSIP